jgi:hypothetical protein
LSNSNWPFLLRIVPRIIGLLPNVVTVNASAPT